jgi:putative Holliday junction resolvase
MDMIQRNTNSEGLPGRLLGIDYGEVRVGLAISDEGQVLATSIGAIKNQNHAQLLKEITEIIRERGVVGVVLGLPLNMKGTEGPMAFHVREFRTRMEMALDPPLPIVLMDERWTSKEALRVLRQGSVKGRKQRQKVDQLSAQIMLQTFLDRNRPFVEEEWE